MTLKSKFENNLDRNFCRRKVTYETKRETIGGGSQTFLKDRGIKKILSETKERETM